MEVMTQRKTGKRSKHYILLLVLPIILAGLGWFLPVGKEPPVVPAEATISLGNYQNQDFNHANQVVSMLTHAPFYEEHLPTFVDDDEILANLTVSALNEKTVKLSYTGTSGEEAAAVVNEVADAFLKVDQQEFIEKQLIVQESVAALDDEEVSPEAKVEQQRFLYELKTTQLDLKPATLLTKAAANELAVESTTLSSKERAVLGGMIGVSLALLTMILPVLVKKS